MTLYAKMIARRMRGDRRPGDPEFVACQAHAFSRFRIVGDQRRSAFIGARQSLAALLGSHLLGKRATAQSNQQAKENTSKKEDCFEWLYHDPSHFLDPDCALLIVWLFGDRIVGIKRHQID